MKQSGQDRVLVIGSGGREAAIVSCLARSPEIGKLFCAPGNAGIAKHAELVPIKANEIDHILDYVAREKIDFVVVAPDDPLAQGLVDRLEAAGTAAFGPTQAAAKLEWSKSFAKEIMASKGIPTAACEVFDKYEEALTYIRQKTCPIVIKADGLALGKGVIIAQTHEEAELALREILLDHRFGSAGSQVLIEDFLTGPELSCLCFTDGKTILPMPSSRDHKRAFDGDQGPNTGGMGAVSPGAELSASYWKLLEEKIFLPTIEAMNERGVPFRGVLYFGLMLCADGPYVIEYNARFGDPESQTILPLLETDLYTIFKAVREGKLAEVRVQWKNLSSCCLVLCSGGYPGEYERGFVIEGLEEFEKEVSLFHAGTSFNSAGQVVTAGGRVLNLTACAPTLEEAIQKVYQAAQKVHFNQMRYRNDIGQLHSSSL